MKKLLLLSVLVFLSPNLAKAECFQSGKNIQQLGELKTVLSCFEEEIKTLKKQLQDGGGGSIVVKAVKGLPEPQVSMSTTSGKHKLDLLSCKRQSTTVKCSFRLTNMGDDGSYRFEKASRAFDELGYEYKPGLTEIADVSADLSGANSVSKHLISGLPVKVTMEFSGVSKDSTQFPALNIKPYYDPFKFRNVAIID